ncbi:Uncharacterized protein TCM_028310 [Theobroma cacao]|uniref:Uncharacterized protein n=1 Tax=Theobroma cacao TaxID=3641 RepID=A0A061G9F6_THECC|nr:Uncharacterized protein TCM_028310 [Theobroma cacao]
MDFVQVANQIFVPQTKYAKDLLKRFKMELYELVPTPLSISDKLCKNDGAAKHDRTKHIRLSIMRLEK